MASITEEEFQERTTSEQLTMPPRKSSVQSDEDGQDPRWHVQEHHADRRVDAARARRARRQSYACGIGNIREFDLKGGNGHIELVAVIRACDDD